MLKNKLTDSPSLQNCCYKLENLMNKTRIPWCIDCAVISWLCYLRKKIIMYLDHWESYMMGAVFWRKSSPELWPCLFLSSFWYLQISVNKIYDFSKFDCKYILITNIADMKQTFLHNFCFEFSARNKKHDWLSHCSINFVSDL